jgi:ABC-type lipoprotein export system ATPase subunit
VNDFDSTAVLRTRGLHKHYGHGEGLVRAVDGVDLDVAAGETVAVMGPSGCGKSTLLHLLGGLDRPSGGEVWLAYRRIDELGEKALARIRRTAIGFVFQAFHLMDELTAVENVELPALPAGRAPRAARRRAAELLERVGLARRPRRVLLGVASIAVTVSGIVAVLAGRAAMAADWEGASSLDPQAERANQVLLLITVMLVALAAINAIVITWAAALDARHASALARALGATPGEVSAGLSAAQVLPAFTGAVLGVAGGLALWTAIGDDETNPTYWQLLAVVAGTVLVVAALTTIPARLAARLPVTETLRAELT